MIWLITYYILTPHMNSMIQYIYIRSPGNIKIKNSEKDGYMFDILTSTYVK